jgi:hypothetical protein
MDEIRPSTKFAPPAIGARTEYLEPPENGGSASTDLGGAVSPSLIPYGESRDTLITSRRPRAMTQLATGVPEVARRRSLRDRAELPQIPWGRPSE